MQLSEIVLLLEQVPAYPGLGITYQGMNDHGYAYEWQVSNGADGVVTARIHLWGAMHDGEKFETAQTSRSVYMWQVRLAQWLEDTIKYTAAPGEFVWASDEVRT